MVRGRTRDEKGFWEQRREVGTGGRVGFRDRWKGERQCAHMAADWLIGQLAEISSCLVSRANGLISKIDFTMCQSPDTCVNRLMPLTHVGCRDPGPVQSYLLRRVPCAHSLSLYLIPLLPNSV